MKRLICIIATFYFFTHFVRANHPPSIAIVLGTTVIDTLPSKAFEHRIKHGIHLYKSETVQKILFTGGIVHGRKYAEAEVAYHYAIRMGVSPQDIILENKATNTIENIRWIKKHLDTTNYQMIFLITDSIHIQRALLITEKEGLQVTPSPSDTEYFLQSFQKFKYKIRESIYRALYTITTFWD